MFNLSLSGYFYLDQDHVYIADASGLTCINLSGVIVWENQTLGIDGVQIDRITKDKIYGCGEFDPPSGWEGFVLNKKDGSTIDIA